MPDDRWATERAGRAGALGARGSWTASAARWRLGGEADRGGAPPTGKLPPSSAFTRTNPSLPGFLQRPRHFGASPVASE